MASQNDWQDNTDQIRRLKHSKLLAQDILKLMQYMQVFRNDEEARQTCPFLSENYPDLFLKIVHKEIDLTILAKILQYLEMIEDGKVDQMEGSVLVGKLLGSLYLDSAIRHGEKLDELYAAETTNSSTTIINCKDVSWSQFKEKNNRI